MSLTPLLSRFDMKHVKPGLQPYPVGSREWRLTRTADLLKTWQDKKPDADRTPLQPGDGPPLQTGDEPIA